MASTSAYNNLIEGLKGIRKKFLEVSKLPELTAHKLLVLSILIKYLEERGDEGGSIFAKNFFKQFGSDDFCGVLRKKGEIINLFEKLGSRFNGRIFEWGDAKEINLLKTTDLSSLADFLDGNNKNNQYVLWRLYSFSHLPVELISSLYEEFLGKGKKEIVYTPHFLVNLLVDECMPIKTRRILIKLLTQAVALVFRTETAAQLHRMTPGIEEMRDSRCERRPSSFDTVSQRASSPCRRS